MKTNLLTFSAIAVSIAALCLSFYSIFSNGSEKLGFVDSERLLTEYSESVKINRELQTEMEKVTKNLSQMDSTIKSLSQAISDSSSRWSLVVRKKRLGLFSKKQDDFNRYRQVSSEQISKKQQESMKPVLAELDIYIKEFARKNGYRLILGTGTGGTILYGDDVADVTEEFVRYAEER